MHVYIYIYIYIYIPAGILCGMLSHPTPKLCARAISNRPHHDSTKRKGPQPYDKGSLAGLLGPGPRIGSSTICQGCLSRTVGAKKAAGVYNTNKMAT